MTLRFRKLGKIFFILIILGIGLFWLNSRFDIFGGQSQDLAAQNPVSPSPAPFIGAPSNPTTDSSPSPVAFQKPSPSASSPPAPKSILLEVPFFAQAPFGEWSDPIFQNACEEASVVMAKHWVDKTWVTKDQAKQEILALSLFEDKTYGTSTDRSAEDTAKIFKDYYGYSNIQARSGISIKDIKAEILKGHLLIVPVNGRILKNPFYTPPGPTTICWLLSVLTRQPANSSPMTLARATASNIDIWKPDYRPLYRIIRLAIICRQFRAKPP